MANEAENDFKDNSALFILYVVHGLIMQLRPFWSSMERAELIKKMK